MASFPFIPSTNISISEDLPERIPDSLLLCIFSKVSDIKTLGRCSTVCKRFYALIPLVEDLAVKVDCVIPVSEEAEPTYSSKANCLLPLIVSGFLKPLSALHRILWPKQSAIVSHHSPREIIKNFKAVRNLRIELPAGEMGSKNGALLKWRADFGSTLESCEILAATSLVNCDAQTLDCKSCKLSSSGVEHALDDVYASALDSPDSISESLTNNCSLKQRVIWTISSLIAASARHYLLQQIILDHPTLERLVLADADGQGTLQMGVNQLQNFRDKPIITSPLSKRTQVPALNIKLWYAPILVLPGGAGMRGATLVAIRPSNELTKVEMESMHVSAFEEPFKTVASMLCRMKRYLLEMNSF